MLCFGAAIQAFFTYPETCGKTLEEIEILFSAEGPRPWNTKPGGSRLDAEIEAVKDRKAHVNGEAEHFEGAQREVDEEKRVQGGQVTVGEGEE